MSEPQRTMARIALIRAMNFPVLIAVGIFLGLWTGGANPASSAILGSCAEYDLPVDKDGIVLRGGQVPVIRHDAPLLNGPSPAAGAKGSSLAFNDRVTLYRRENGYVEVKNNFRDVESLGWVHGDHLLCAQDPVVSSETGLAQKFFIRTRATVRGERVEPVRAAPGSDIVNCDAAGVRCRELSRFSLYYVHAIDFTRKPERLLLVNQYIVDSNATMIGWVNYSDSDPDQRDGFLWATRYGVRPVADLTFTADQVYALRSDPESSDRADSINSDIAEGAERAVCVHETAENAARGEHCVTKILGGYRWFTDPLRIPVLSREQVGAKGVFRVIMPISGVGQDVDADSLFDQLRGLSGLDDKIRQLRKLDIFFLIDGTQSMEPHIDAVVGRNASGGGILGRVIEAFETDSRFSGVQVRFGFRVYRDAYAGEWELGEGYPLGTNCNPREEDLVAERKAFQQAAMAIDTQAGTNTGRKDPDHEENLYGGIIAAVSDMGSCDDHVKLLFVIGDTGYDARSQEAQGAYPVTEEQLSAFMTRQFDPKKGSVIPFFIQVPAALNSQEYIDAYAKFEEQAATITRPILEHNGAEPEQLANHVIRLGGSTIPETQDQLISKIMDRVAGFGDQRPINELLAELQGGAALVEVIEYLREGFDNVPGIRFAEIERRLCDELGASCTERIYDDISEGYILDNEDVATDIWMRGDEFRMWQRTVEAFKPTEGVPLAPELAQMMVDALVYGVERTVGDVKPSDIGTSIGEFVRKKHGLPIADHSPLLLYSVGDLMRALENPETATAKEIDDCELFHLAAWVDKHREIFNNIAEGLIPTFELKEGTGYECTLRHPTPRLELSTPRRFPEATMSYSYALEGSRIYWVPQEYLP